MRHPPPDPPAGRAGAGDRSRRPFSLQGSLPAAILFVTLSGLYAAGYVRYRDAVREALRDEVAGRLAGHAFALGTALDRRATLLRGIRAWIGTHPEAGAADFEAFAAGLARGMEGMRAIQVVRGGRIVRSWPAEGNEGALGYDLLAHPDRRIPSDLRRAYASGEVTLSGPVELVQGGSGLILRLAPDASGDLAAPSAAVVLDLRPVLAEAGLVGARLGGLRVGLSDALGRVVFGDRPGEDPVERTVPLPDGSWRLGAVPDGGWFAAVGARSRTFALSGAFGVVLLTLVGHLARERHTGLERQVAARTVALKEAARELTEQDERLNAALEAGRAFAWSWEIGSDRVVRSPGARDVVGSDEAFPGSLAALRERVHPDDRAELERAIDEAVRSSTLSAEYRLLRPDGRTVWVRDEGKVAVPPGTRGPARMVGVTADVTRIKELEREVVEARRIEEVGRLAATIAHEFNNLLTVMAVNLELVQDTAEGEARRDLEEVRRAVGHAELLTRRLLAFSRRDVTHPEPLEADAAVEEALAVLGPIVEPLDVSFEPGADGARVRMDRSRLTQTLFDLVSNARDVLPHGGWVRIATRLDVDPPGSAVVRLTVEDGGPGVPEPLLGSLFEPFVSGSSSERHTGLGLSTVSRCVEEAGGSIRVENVPEGGARFTVTLPALEPVPGPEPPPGRPVSRGTVPAPGGAEAS